MFRKLFAVLTLVLALPAFANAAWTVKASSANPTYGTVTPSGYNAYADSDKAAKTFTVTPGGNYQVSSILVDNVDVKSGIGTQTVSVPYKFGTTILVAKFTAKQYSVTAGAVTGKGSITSTSPVLVNAGANKTFSILPNPGNRLLSVQDNGNEVTPISASGMSYTVTNVQVPHVITATFGGVTANAGVVQNTAKNAVVTLKGTGTVFNQPASYKWTVVYAPAGSGLAAGDVISTSAQPTFSNATIGTYNFKLEVTDGLDLTAKATATTSVNVYDNYIDAANAAVNSCVVCHAPQAKFTQSYHWNNHLEYGPEFTGGAVEGQLNANESYTTLEDGKAATCYNRCHFKSTKNATGCNTCHSSGGLATNGANADATLIGMDAPTPTVNNTCLYCHSGSKHGKVPNEFHASAHWNNHLEYGPEFTGGAVEGQLDANNSYTTKEDGAVVTCAYRCHFKPGMGPKKDVAGYLANGHSTSTLTYTDTLNNVVYSRPGGDDCLACHDSHNPDTADYRSTCLVCHSGSKHGKVPNEFWGSAHWNNHLEVGAEFKNQISTTVVGGNVKYGENVDGILNANDSYTTTEAGAVVSCAYRCHFRPGMGPQQNVSGYLANGKSTTYVTYSSPYGAGKFSRPGGDACMACHDAHGLEATARSTCYTCHTGSKHGIPVKQFEKSTHFTSPYAIAEGLGGPNGKACTFCHNAHSTEAAFFTMSTATTVKAAIGCQECHVPGRSYAIYNADGTMKTPHALATVNSWAEGSTAAYTANGVTCGECHGHNNTINAGWAAGGHGDLTTNVWKGDADHKDWGAQGTDGVNFQVSPQKTNCIRCHSAKGFAKFVDSNFTDISKLPASEKANVLTCSGCHSSADGALRAGNMKDVGYKAFWGYSGANTTKKIVSSIQLADNRNSNICMPCHSQRASGDQIKQAYAAATATGVTAIGSTMYPHAAQPAAIFNGKGGYEFTSAQGYQDRARHQRIGNYVAGGTTGYNNTGTTQGSCVACHMNSAETHSLEITSVTFTNTCYKCHPSSFNQAEVDAKKVEFDAAVKALGALLVKKGISLDGINPLPERKSFDMSLGSGDVAVAEKNTGAWFNWYLFSTADKGAYAHNPSYARRLIFDSIDWLDDSSINGSAGNAILSLGNTEGKLTAAEAAAAGSFTNDPGCLGCHFGSTDNVANGESIPAIEKAPHFNTDGTLVAGQTFTQAQFVVAGTQCNYCHGYGHGTDSPSYSFSTAAFPKAAVDGAKPSITEEYAASAHGDINGLAWTDYDFKTRATCAVCHTTNGFVTAVDSNFAKTGAWGTTGDTAKQVLACNACHSSTSWKTSVRNVNLASLGAVSKIAYDNAGESNVCIPCHATRENTASVNAVPDFTNASFKNPHYLGAAAVFYGKGGFQFYTSGVRYNTYGAAGKVGRNANWSHGKLGMDNYTTTSNAAVKASGVVYGSGNKGQCVACHLGPINTHTFGAAEVANATLGTSTNTRGCYGCHTSTTGTIQEFIEEEKVIWDRMMDFFAFTLEQVNMKYTPNHPYFVYKTAIGSADNQLADKPILNWTYPATGPQGGTGAQTMGAAMNFKLLDAEPGKHVHNRSFGRALIADSIVYLQKGSVGDRSVVAEDVNSIINFSSYSAAKPTDANGVSISTLKSYLTKAASIPGKPDGFARR